MMKLSEVLKAFRLIKTGTHDTTQFQKYQPQSSVVTEMISGAGIGHHHHHLHHQSSPYGHHVLVNPHYGHRGSIPGVASVTHIIRHAGSGTSASGSYGGNHHGYQSNDYGSSGHAAPAGYDYHPAHPAPPAAAVHVPIADTTGPVHSTGKSGKTGGSSTITALTLLSFLFFLNILQSCLKEHMDTMNPTVMVMTAGVARTRVSKLAEMNSREQQNPIPQSVLTLNRGEPGYAADASVNVPSQTPFNGGGTKVEYNSNRPDPEPEYYPAYVNRTMTSLVNDNNYHQDRYHYPYRHYQRLPGPIPSPSPSSSSASSFSSGSNSPVSNYYSETMDPYYTRIN
ncbi:protein dissatisfaction [Eupeodes corollae]|uniref:protein dissatisfaction n=1 Tax=Eupeodes corollae TaxID=290404 RepID=UPI002493CD1D|nr:protein dissatisfaction [Eupeodes corollae]